ncbi:MAG TPA: hypothetical protein VJ873_02065 [bacterium]|nr:hypothetical protein [bacterium]
MKKFLAMVSVFGLAVFLVAGTWAFADDSTATASTTPTSSTSKGTKHSKKKKTAAAPTSQATSVVTVSLTPQATPGPTVALKAAVTSNPVASSAPTLFSGNGRLYDRVGTPRDLQKAISAAARVIGNGPLKHDRSVFLWLGRVTNGSDEMRNNSYVRFNLDGITFAGPKKPSLILTGSVSDQSGSDLKAGDPIEVAVDFREIKVDYEGTKLGEVNKGNDITDQVFDILNGHSSYQWVLIAQDQVRDPQDSMGMPTFVVKAQEGYAFLQALTNH